jgi:hypothetical protein
MGWMGWMGNTLAAAWRLDLPVLPFLPVLPTC